MIKLKSLLNEKLVKSNLRKLPRGRKKPKSIIALRIKRVERGGGEVTNQELIDIFKSPDFPERYRTPNYVYYVELKKAKDEKKVAIVNIFEANNLPDYIKLTDPVDFELDGAKVYLEIPTAIRYRKDPTTTTKKPKLGDEKIIDGKLHTWNGTKWILEPIGSKFKIGDTKEIDGKLHTWDGTKWILKTATDANNTSTTNTVPPGTPLLKRGSRGESVEQLQTLLGLTGDSVDGVFGGETAAWLTIWQEEHKLTADGIYGPKTAAAMKNDLTPVKDKDRAKRLTNTIRAAIKKSKQTKTIDPLIQAFNSLNLTPAETTGVAGMTPEYIKQKLKIDLPNDYDISSFFDK